MEGYQRIKMILEFSGKPITSSDANAKYPRDLDMENRVAAVLAIIASKSPLSLFDNHYMREYLALLDSKHSPPHRLERLRIIQVVMDLFKLEFARIMNVSYGVLPCCNYNTFFFKLTHHSIASLSICNLRRGVMNLGMDVPASTSTSGPTRVAGSSMDASLPTLLHRGTICLMARAFSLAMKRYRGWTMTCSTTRPLK